MEKCPEWCVEHVTDGGDVLHQGERTAVDLPCDAGTASVWLSWPPTLERPVIAGSTSNRAEVFELTEHDADRIAGQFEELACAFRTRASRLRQQHPTRLAG